MTAVVIPVVITPDTPEWALWLMIWILSVGLILVLLILLVGWVWESFRNRRRWRK